MLPEEVGPWEAMEEPDSCARIASRLNLLLKNSYEYQFDQYVQHIQEEAAANHGVEFPGVRFLF